MTPGTWPPLRVTMRDVGFEARDLSAVYCTYIMFTTVYYIYYIAVYIS